jgi:hypothetical protein
VSALITEVEQWLVGLDDCRTGSIVGEVIKILDLEGQKEGMLMGILQ